MSTLWGEEAPSRGEAGILTPRNYSYLLEEGFHDFLEGVSAQCVSLIADPFMMVLMTTPWFFPFSL